VHLAARQLRESEHADVGESGLFLQPLTILNPRFVRFNVTFDF
jgi:hypothetical protein